MINTLYLVLFGSLWGAIEVFGGELLFRYDIPFKSVILAVCGLFILSLSRGINNKQGTSSLIALFSAFYKLVNTSPYFCHLTAIISIGISFDLFASILLRPSNTSKYRYPAVAFLSVLTGRILFVALSAFIFRIQRWVNGSSSYILGHIFVRGTMAAIPLVFLIPLGFFIGSTGSLYLSKKPHLATIIILFGLIFSWTIGFI